MYAVSLTTGQSITVGNNSGGNTAVTYNGTASSLTVILTPQQYALLPRAVDPTTGVTNYTDVSVPGQSVLNLTIPSSAGVICAGKFVYLGCSVQASAAASFQIQDSKGSFNGSTYSAQTIQEVDFGAAGTFEKFYPYSVTVNNRVIGGIPVIGNLTVASITGTYNGVVRIAGF